MTRSPAPKRWLRLGAGAAALAVAAGWGLLAPPAQAPDFTVYHLPMRVLFPVGCLALVALSLRAFFRLFPEALPAPTLSLASLPAAVASAAVLVAAFAASVGLARGLNALLEDPRVERREGTLVGLAVDGSEHQVARLRLGDFETLELGLARMRELGLDVGSPVSVELHRGPLFSWGWVHGARDAFLLHDGP